MSHFDPPPEATSPDTQPRATAALVTSTSARLFFIPIDLAVPAVIVPFGARARQDIAPRNTQDWTRSGNTTCT